MVKKYNPAIFSNQIKNLLASSIFIKLLILVIILTLTLPAGQNVYAQIGFYNPFASNYSSYSPQYGINSAPTYSNSYFSSNNYAIPSLSSYYSNPSTSNYTAQNSFYYPGNVGYTTPGFSYSTTAGNYYNTQNSYNTAQNSFYYPGGVTTSYPAQGSYYYTNTGAAQTNSYYNAANTYYPATNNYNPFGTSYYSNATTYFPSSGGYVINSTSNVSGTWIGTWVRTFSATGAPTAQSRSGSSSSHSMMDGSSSNNSGSSNRFSAEDIKIELAQNGASVNGTVTFFENTVINQIPVSGSLTENVLDLYGTTGAATNPYGLQVTATVNVDDTDITIQGAYTLTNTATNANIEVGTFSVEK